jgi:ATP-dependent helicase/nuclease subunit A
VSDADRFGPIFDPTKSVILVASAGTGKTWRLVRRYLRIIAGEGPGSDGEGAWARPEQVVAVTFTRAAAAQMRARVFAALTSIGASEDDPVLSEIVERRTLDWRLKLAEQVAPAPIGTLHSLCARMLAEFPELSGVPPDARPLEPAEQSLELDAFVSAWLDRAVDDPRHTAHAACVELLRAHPLGFIRRELRAMVDDRNWTLTDLATDLDGGHSAGLPRAGQSPSRAPYPSGSPVGAPSVFDWRDPAAILASREHFVRTQWREYMHYIQMPLALLLNACVSSTARSSTKLTELRELASRILKVHVPEPAIDRIVADFQALLAIRPSQDLGPVLPALQHLRNSHRVLSTRRELPVMPDPAAALDRSHADHLARWVALAAMVRSEWAAKLRERAVLRYDDLELLTWTLLADPRAQAHVRGRYRHVLVDEYQDISPLQAQIIDRLIELCGDGESEPVKLFFVGDPKQSIYRFRGADPEVSARAVYRHVQDGPGELVRLAENRRSSPALTRFFSQLFPPLFAGVLPWANITDLGRPPELARLRDVLDHAPVPWDGDIVTVRERDRLPGLGVDLMLRDRGRPADDPAFADEAERVAAHVRGLLDGATLEQVDGSSPVQLRARDFAILLPRWNLTESYRAALERHGIVADLAGGRGLLLLPEVRDLINLVRLWADEQDELAALAVLRGPCFAISDLGLYVLARWSGVDRRVREADPELPEFAELDEVWEPWDDESELQRPHPRRIREVLRHGRLDPDRALASLAAANVLVPDGGEAPDEALARLHARLSADATALEAGRDRFLAFMRQAGARSTADLLADVIAAFRLEAHWLAGARGRRGVANAWRFVEHVRTLETEGPDLQRVSIWLDAGAEPAPEGLISPEADAVTITTWHGAKGKEWPVVVVAGIGEFREAGARTSWSGAPIPTLDSGRGERIPVPRIRQPHQGFTAIEDPLHAPCANMLAPLEAAEAKRLLYVAMTRASDRLVLSGEADRHAHVHYDDKPWLGLDHRFDMKPLIGEPKPAYLCKRPIELLVAGLDLPAASPVSGVIRPRAATWSLAHVRVIDDAMLRAGLGRTPRVEPEPPPAPVPMPTTGLHGPSGAAGKPVQLGFLALLGEPEEVAPPTRKRKRKSTTPPPALAITPEPPAKPPWRAGPAMQTWNPSSGRSPWPVSELAWEMPLPARRPALLDEEDPRLLGELFHRAMEQWDFAGEPPRTRELEPLVAIMYASRDAADRRRIASWLVRCVELFAEDEPLLAELRAARDRDELFHEVDVDALVAEQAGDHRITGRLDLLWRSTDGLWNVLDYKVTSKIRSREQMQELQWEYGGQLLSYRNALTRWRPRGELQYFGRFGLWLATAGKAMWLLNDSFKT